MTVCVSNLKKEIHLWFFLTGICFFLFFYIFMFMCKDSFDTGLDLDRTASVQRVSSAGHLSAARSVGEPWLKFSMLLCLYSLMNN